MKECYVVASRAHAKFMSRESKHSHLKIIFVLDNPEGRLRNHELESDKGSLRKAHSHDENSPHERELKKFCKKIALYIESKFEEHEMSGICIFSETHMLALLKKAVAKTSVNANEIKWVAKDLDKESLPEIESRIAGIKRAV